MLSFPVLHYIRIDYFTEGRNIATNRDPETNVCDGIASL